MKGIYFDKEEKGLYINNIERMDPVGTIKYAKKADREQVNPESVRSTCTRSRSGIQSNKNEFKIIGFINSKRGQTGEPIGDKKFMAYLEDTQIVLNDNRLPFKNNIKYTWAKFIQDSKMIKGLMEMFFNNPDLAPIWKYLSYKNMDKIRPLLTELLYGKITW